METPRLVAPGVRSFMDFTLRNCRQVKDSYTTIAVNVGLTVVFVLVIGGFLYYKYRGKPTKAELEARKRQGQEYVMRKLGSHVATRQMANAGRTFSPGGPSDLGNSSQITGLPIWEKSLLLPAVSGN